MEREVMVNKVLRDMVSVALISEDCKGDARVHLMRLAVAVEEQKTKELAAHNKRKVEQFNRFHVKMDVFDSILDAAAANKCNRDVIDDSISGRTLLTRGGYYYRYAE